MQYGRNIIRTLALNLIFALPLLPLIWTVISLDYTAYNNSSDTFLYLNIADNILAGRGPVISFNVYQFWTGIFYPATLFVHTGFSYILAALQIFLHSIQALILFNFIFVFLNLWLIFLIAKKLYNDEVLGAWAAVFIAATVCVQITSLRLLTEQANLLLTLFAAYLFISKEAISRRRITVIGLLLAGGIFLRSASVIYPFAFFIAALSGGRKFKEKLGSALPYVLWPMSLLALYEVFIYLQFHAFFPQYPLAFKDYYLAASPSADTHFALVNIADMAKVLFCILRVFVVFALLRAFKVIKISDRKEGLFLWLAILQIGATLFFYPYMRIGEFQWTRFLLLPVVSLALLSLKEFKFFCQRFFPRTKALLFHSVLAIVFLSNLYQSGKVLEEYWKEAKIGTKVGGLSAISSWVKRNVAQDGLVAVSEFIIGGVYLERPAVVLPAAEKNMDVFLSTYKPKAVIFEKTFALEQSLLRSGYKKTEDGFAGSIFVIMER